MSTSKGKFVLPLILVMTVAAVGGAYTLGRNDFDPVGMFRGSAKTQVAELTTDSTTLGDSVVARCARATDGKTPCISKTLDSLAALGEVRLAMVSLKRILEKDASVGADGHVFAHGIGIAAGKSKRDIAQLFAQCDESNESGCYHGVLQGYFLTAGKVGPEQVNSACQSFSGPEADRWLRFQCVHGTGHGLTMYYSHDVPQALKSCDYLSDGWDKRSCYAGVFMENIVNAQKPHPVEHMAGHEGMHHEGTAGAMASGPMAKPFKALDPKDPLYPCSIMDARYLAACYEMQTAAILHLNQGDIAATARTCDTAPKTMRNVCYQSLGRDISALSNREHVKAIEMCGRGTEKYQPWCYFGLVKSFVNMNAKADEGLTFCRELTGTTNKLKCYEAVGEQIGTLRNGQAERGALCQPAEEAFREACLYGARVTGVAPAGLTSYNASSFL